MRPTRRWAVLAGTACFFAVFAVVLDERVPLFAAAGLTAWLLVAQLDAVRTMQTADELLTTSVSVEPTNVSVDDRAAITVTASLSTPIDAPLTVELVSPPSVDAPADAQRRFTLEPGETTGSTTYSVSFPIAGRITFETVRIDIEDRAGYFTETVTKDASASCLVDSATPTGIHVGKGGEHTGAIFGSHSSNKTGPGLTPHETRQYLPGDSLSQIDWKTTARMSSPYIRQFETESDFMLSVVVDGGSHMNRGPTGRTMFAYAREVALGLVQVAESYGDPVAMRLVGTDATLWEFGPSSASGTYQTMRRKLLSFSPGAGPQRSAESARLVSPTTALDRGRTLEDVESRFARTLRPYLTASTSYVSRVSERPLFVAVKASCGRTDRDEHLVLVTDDSAKVETYESVVAASKHCTQTTVFLTPTVLFDESPTDHDEFAAFESFRRRLDDLPNVTAYEVAPRDAVELATATTAQPIE
ncbi:DUF58 domain-containing protein [Haloferax sp. DFSO52]|uniref:DUF58 domain-containing protein n=1 Tax=Haloferax sp. DFSO52 TaxID=3388505 RepID=UPI003A888BF0